MSATNTADPRRITIHDLQERKARGQRFAMLTSYDTLSAGIFEEAGVDVLLVGDSAANTVLGYPDTLAVTVDELLPLVRAVVRGTSRAMVVADLPFGSYQASPQHALDSAVRFMKEAGAQAVKFEGGARVAEHVRTVVEAGVPVMAHIGFTPQSVHGLGGYRVQGRGDDADRILKDAHALQDAGAFSIVLELVPAQLAARVTSELRIPTIGIGAGVDCDRRPQGGLSRVPVRARLRAVVPAPGGIDGVLPSARRGREGSGWVVGVLAGGVAVVILAEG